MDSSSLSIGHPPGARLTFLVVRRRAMASGSPSALYMMLMILKCQLPEVTLEQMQRQFEKEYRITISDAGRHAAGPFPPPTQTELDEEWGYLEQRLSRVQLKCLRHPPK
ncbi:hypothetical protein B0H17DRAFT_1143816 [Mycena rosella]|uniref:Uncharacterized protein n=1 Tax=Mycena rosella TaxID=1033263 RepID=A0AAD7CV39_MYCRO|nr:hypothetical protein B0H17DRAFT_1143816 [Mycena rosella]